MDFGFTEEQDLLRVEVRKFLDARAPMSEVRRLAATRAGHSPELWQELARLGWLGLIIPSDYGGAELTWVDFVVLLEETGRSLFPSPLVSTTLAASAIATEGSEAQKQRYLPGLADGSRIGTVALLEQDALLGPEGVTLAASRDGDGYVLRGEKRYVGDVTSANLFVVSFRTGPAATDVALGLVEGGTPDVRVVGHRTMDATKRMGTLVLEDVRIEDAAVLRGADATGGGWPAIARLLDRGAIAVTAEMVGAAEGAHALTVRYAKERTQFGAPIGKYQGVKHPLAEMYVDLESMKSLVYFAAWALDASPDEVPRAASIAKAYASDAFARIGIDSVQLHGAVGYTAEYDVQLYLKRSKWARPTFGDSDVHYERVAALGGL